MRETDRFFDEREKNKIVTRYERIVTINQGVMAMYQLISIICVRLKNVMDIKM